MRPGSSSRGLRAATGASRRPRGARRRRTRRTGGAAPRTGSRSPRPARTSSTEAPGRAECGGGSGVRPAPSAISPRPRRRGSAPARTTLTGRAPPRPREAPARASAGGSPPPGRSRSRRAPRAGPASTTSSVVHGITSRTGGIGRAPDGAERDVREHQPGDHAGRARRRRRGWRRPPLPLSIPTRRTAGLAGARASGAPRTRPCASRASAAAFAPKPAAAKAAATAKPSASAPITPSGTGSSSSALLATLSRETTSMLRNGAARSRSATLRSLGVSQPPFGRLDDDLSRRRTTTQGRPAGRRRPPASPGRGSGNGGRCRRCAPAACRRTARAARSRRRPCSSWRGTRHLRARATPPPVRSARDAGRTARSGAARPGRSPRRCSPWSRSSPCGAPRATSRSAARQP